MNISDQFRCIFIHIPKAAGTSVKKALSLPGQGHPPWQYFAQNFPDKWKRYHRFTIVRNPWDRVVSAYSYARMRESYWHNETVGLHPDHEILKNKSFTECCHLLMNERGLLRHESWHPQHLWVTRQNGGRVAFVVDTVMRCESLDTDFENLCIRLGIPAMKLPLMNRSKRALYRRYYDTKTRKIIARIYRKDIELFGYSY